MASQMTLAPVALKNRYVCLEPLSAAHFDSLAPYATDESLWRFTTVEPNEAGFRRWFDTALAEHAAGRQIVYAVRRARDDEVVGSTRFLEISPAHRRVEIGFTWYRPDAQGGEVNPACKLLLLHQAFAAGANRVELKCDARNRRSRAAITKLGATEEGTLRRHMVLADGALRDTVYYSILSEEWPAVRAGLQARLPDYAA